MTPTGATNIVTLASYFGSPSAPVIMAVMLTLLFIWWAVFTVVALYHLFRYARDSWITIPAIALHFAISAWLFVFMTSNFH